jgi:hypothetical protein
VRDPFLITCPLCRKRFRLPRWAASGRVPCPGCWEQIDVVVPPSAQASLWLQWWNMRPRSLIPSWFHPIDPRNTPEFLDAEQWAITYAPTHESEVYDSVVEFAKEQFEFVAAATDTLDKKADGWARFAAAIAGATVTAASTNIIKIGNNYPFIVGGVLVLVSVFVAVRAGMPLSALTPITVRNLLKVADHPSAPSETQIKSATAASFHVAIEGTNQINQWKSRLIKVSFYVFMLGYFMILSSLRFR